MGRLPGIDAVDDKQPGRAYELAEHTCKGNQIDMAAYDQAVTAMRKNMTQYGPAILEFTSQPRQVEGQARGKRSGRLRH